MANKAFGFIATGIALIMFSLMGCKIEINVPTGGRVLSQDYACEANTVCTIDVSETSFDQTFQGVPGSDALTFTGWKKGPRQFCGTISGPCQLYTTSFDDNEILLGFLQSEDEIFHLTPKFEEISDNQPPGAKAFILNSENILRGYLGGDRVTYDDSTLVGTDVDDSDYLVFVAPADGTLRLRLTELASDLDLSLETALVTVVGWSQQFGTAPETITSQVTAGETYFVNVYGYDELPSHYKLTVNFEADVAPDAPGDIAGTYTITPEPAFGYCENGHFTEFQGNEQLMDEALVYRKYVSDIRSGSFTKSELHKTYHANGKLAWVGERLLTGRYLGGRLRGESVERGIEYESDGERYNDCILNWDFSGTRGKAQEDDPM